MKVKAIFVCFLFARLISGKFFFAGLPGFRRKNNMQKAIEIAKVGALFPFYCLMYMAFPYCESSQVIRKPFMKFLIHASSYMFFLCKSSLS